MLSCLKEVSRFLQRADRALGALYLLGQTECTVLQGERCTGLPASRYLSTLQQTSKNPYHATLSVILALLRMCLVGSMVTHINHREMAFSIGCTWAGESDILVLFWEVAGDKVGQECTSMRPRDGGRVYKEIRTRSDHPRRLHLVSYMPTGCSLHSHLCMNMCMINGFSPGYS